MRFAPQIHVFCDARSLLYLKFCKASNPLLTRFSLTLSNYECSITHISSKENELGDILSRVPNATSSSMIDDDKRPPMTEKEANLLLQKLCLPDNFEISMEQYKKLLNTQSLPSLFQTKPKQSRASKIKITPHSLRPQSVQSRKVTIPKVMIDRQLRLAKVRENKENKSNNQMQHQNFTIIDLEPQEDRDVFRFEMNNKVLEEGSISFQDFREAQEQDEFCKDIMSKTPLPRHYKVKKGILIRTIKGGKERLVLPFSLLTILLYSIHHTIRGRHNSVTAMRKIIHDQYFINGLIPILKKFVGSCYYCIRDKNDNKKLHVIREIPKATYPRHTYHYDILCGLTTHNNQKMIHVWVDQFTNYVTLVPAKSKTKEELLRVFKENIIRPYGTPKCIVTDGEGSTKSNIFTEFCELNGIQVRNTAAHSPQSNSTAELSCKRTKQVLRAYVHQTGDSWPNDLVLLQQALNATKLSYCNFSPEQLLFGQEIPSDNEFLHFRDKCYTIEEYVKKVQELSNKRRDTILNLRKKRNDAMREIANQTREEHNFHNGQIVFAKNMNITPIEGGGLSYRYDGPMIILKINEDQSTAILRDLKTQRTRKTHYNHIRPIYSTFRPFGIKPKVEALKLIQENKVTPYALRNRGNVNNT